MTAYLHWNDALLEHFFRPELAGRPVYLYVTGELISELGKSLGGAVPEFVAAVKEGPPWVTREGFCQRALQALEGWRERGLHHPPYVGYLALFVLAAGIEGDFASHAYYPRLRRLLEYPEEGGMLPSFERMLALWEDLERWSVHDRNGELGIFTARFVGEWIHVGVPTAQTVLSEQERRALPTIFWEGGLDPSSPPPEAELARCLRVYGAGRLRARTLDLVGKRSDEELYRALIQTVGDELAEWDGNVDEEVADLPAKARSLGTVRLCLWLDSVAGRARATVRCRLGGPFPDARLVLASPGLQSQLWCDEFLAGWSIPLASTETNEPLDAAQLSWARGAVFANESGSWQFKLPGRPVRILVEGLSEGLPDLIEVYQTPRSRPFYLLAQDDCWRKLEPWLRDECRGLAEYRITEGLPPGWRLASLKQALSDSRIRAAFPFLALPERPRIRFHGGIRRSRGNTFFAFAAPSFFVEGGDGSEQVVCEGRVLSARAEDGRYRLPRDIPLDSRLSIEVRRRGEAIARQSIYLTSSFGWRRTSPLQEFDGWGRPLREGTQIRIAGALVNGAEDPGGFVIPATMAPGLEGRLQGRVFFVGRAPGQIANWPAEPLPEDWRPVWAIPLGRRGRAIYCGGSVDDCMPVGEPLKHGRLVAAWKDVLWRRRKRIAPPERPALSRLWRKYQEAARRV